MEKITKREVAHRIFSFEIEETSVELSEHREEKSPNYVITPTGLKVNRLLAVGKLLRLPEQVGEQEKDLWKLTISDGVGHFTILPPQYNTEITTYVKSIVNKRDIPRYVFVVGKVKPYKGENGKIYRVFVKPEILCDSSEDVYNYWIIQTAKFLLRRLECLEELEKMEPPSLENLVALGFTKSEAEAGMRALQYYGISRERIQSYREKAIEALQTIAEGFGGEGEEEKVYEIIKGFKEEGVDLEELAKVAGMDVNKVEEISLVLIQKGLVDEPFPGRYRAIEYE